MRASSCSRAAIEPGNRWIAGGVEQRAVNASGSAAAIRAGSRVPNRSSTFAGPRNACSIGYCWSSIIPTSSANGSSVRTWSAAASPVMWMATYSVGLDREHRAVRVEKHPLGVAAEDQLADRRTPAQADDDELRVARLGDAQQVLCGLEATHQLPEVELDAGLLEGPAHVLHLALGLGRRVGVEVGSATVRVDDDEFGLAQPGLIDGLLQRCFTLGLRHVSHDDGSHDGHVTCGGRTHAPGRWGRLPTWKGSRNPSA